MGCCKDDKSNEDHECDCNHGHEMSMEQLVSNNNVVLNKLIDILVKKKVFDEKEFIAELNSVDEEE